MAAVAAQVSAGTQEQYLMKYIAAVEAKLEAAGRKTYMSQLNQARNGMKHHGNLPRAESADSF